MSSERDRQREELGQRGEREVEAPESGPLERLASRVGNRGFTELARMGEGILPDGRAHPDVEAAIATSRGRGAPLDKGSRERFSEGLGDPLTDVRVHTGSEADSLARAVSARAFTVGRDMFFAHGEHRPGTTEGDKLMAHELTHAVQQRGAPLGGPLYVSQPGEHAEGEADRAADELAG
jgi:hypothetical protein